MFALYTVQKDSESDLGLSSKEELKVAQKPHV